MEHVSVLLNESIKMLQIKDDGVYVDCTLGRGGHSSEILKDVPEVIYMHLTAIKTQLMKVHLDFRK